ncbi:MAG: TM2 domain-containing protein [Ruminococcus sp.]|nr:TM2 domain-containing protein [Ruminococcus sp.]
MEQKSKMTAGLLGIFLGAFGVHQFYLGNTKRAIIEIVVTLVTCGIGGWWGIIEGIMILMGKINTDANGNPLAD